MDEEKTLQSPFDVLDPQIRDVAISAVGKWDPNSWIGQGVIGSSIMFFINYGNTNPEEKRRLAGQAAKFYEQAMRLVPENFPDRDSWKNNYGTDAIQMYEVAGNIEKVTELQALIPKQ